MKQETMHIVHDIFLYRYCIGHFALSEMYLIWTYLTFRQLTVHVFGEFQACSRKTPISYMSVRPFVRIYHRRLPVDGFFRGIWYWEILRKSVEKLHIWLQYFTCRPKYVYIVAGSTKYFVLRKECIGNSLLNFGSNTELFYIVDSYCRPTAIKRGCLVACPWQ
jgi:hypothetical protein